MTEDSSRKKTSLEENIEIDWLRYKLSADWSVLFLSALNKKLQDNLEKKLSDNLEIETSSNNE